MSLRISSVAFASTLESKAAAEAEGGRSSVVLEGDGNIAELRALLFWREMILSRWEFEFGASDGGDFNAKNRADLRFDLAVGTGVVSDSESDSDVGGDRVCGLSLGEGAFGLTVGAFARVRDIGAVESLGFGAEGRGAFDLKGRSDREAGVAGTLSVLDTFSGVVREKASMAAFVDGEMPSPCRPFDCEK